MTFREEIEDIINLHGLEYEIDEDFINDIEELVIFNIATKGKQYD